MDNNPNDGSKVGLFLRAPDAVAAMRGALPEDDSPAHVTFLILGDLRPFGGPEVLLDALRAAITNHPSRCWAVLDRVRVSTNTQGQKVAWQEVYFEDGGFGPRSWPSLCRMREALVADLRGVRGLPIKDHSPDRWTPHFTRAYLPPDVLAYTDEPIWAAWQVNQIEVWGYGAPLCVDLRTGGLVPSRDLAFELAKALSPHRAKGPRVAHRVPSWLGALLMAHQGLHKGASHKYLRKIPTGKAGKTGKPLYRYYYTVGGGAGLGHHDEFKVGAAFAVKDAGKAGHFHITEDHGDEVTIKHDESGKSSRVAKDALRSMLHNEHAEAIGAARQKALDIFEQAKKTGTKKQQQRAEEAAKRAGAYVPEAAPERDPKLDEPRWDVQDGKLKITLPPVFPDIPKENPSKKYKRISNRLEQMENINDRTKFEVRINLPAGAIPTDYYQSQRAVALMAKDLLEKQGIDIADEKYDFDVERTYDSGSQQVARFKLIRNKDTVSDNTSLITFVFRAGKAAQEKDMVSPYIRSTGPSHVYSGQAFTLEGHLDDDMSKPTDSAPKINWKHAAQDRLNLSTEPDPDAGHVHIEGRSGVKAWLAQITGNDKYYKRERSFFNLKNSEHDNILPPGTLKPGVYEYNHFLSSGSRREPAKTKRGFFVAHADGTFRHLEPDEVDDAVALWASGGLHKSATKALAPSITKALANLYGLAPSRA